MDLISKMAASYKQKTKFLEFFLNPVYQRHLHIFMPSWSQINSCPLGIHRDQAGLIWSTWIGDMDRQTWHFFVILRDLEAFFTKISQIMRTRYPSLKLEGTYHLTHKVSFLANLAKSYGQLKKENRFRSTGKRMS